MEMRRLNDLKATNPYLRMGTDVTELEKSIQTVGLIAPLVISPDNVILAGARRFQALLNLGYTEAPVMVIDKGELERELISIDENLVRKDLNKIEIEGHLRRAKELYQALNPIEEVIESEEVSSKQELDENPEVIIKKTVLPAEKFLNIVAEKTGLSPKQIHEAINRDEMASNKVKEARKNGELSLSQTNEIVKLKKEDQEKSITHLKTLPVKDIRKFVKLAKTKGVDEAILETPKDPHARDFIEIESALKKLTRKTKQLELEGISLEDYPATIQMLFKEIFKLNDEAEFSIRAPEENHFEESYS